MTDIGQGLFKILDACDNILNFSYPPLSNNIWSSSTSPFEETEKGEKYPNKNLQIILSLVILSNFSILLKRTLNVGNETQIF